MNVTAIEVVVVACIVAVCGLIGWGAYEESQRPGFELKKADWVCTQAHVETSGYIDPSSHVWVDTSTTVCDEYRRVQ